MNHGGSTPGQDNLLVVLYRLAHRQQENFTTDSLTHLLRHLVEDEPSTAGRVLDWLTDTRWFSSRGSLDNLWIRTQIWAGENGIPDIRIEDEGRYVIVEVKLGSWLTLEQMEAYETELKGSGRTNTKLVALTGSEPPDPLPGVTRMRTWDDLELNVRTWGELGSRLVQETSQSGSEVTKHLASQLAGFLGYLGLMPPPVPGPLFEELKKHRVWAKEHPDEPAVTRTRLRSLDRMREMPHTTSLYNLLQQMRSVLDATSGVETCGLDSAPYWAPPWIGFNINGMKYFFFVRLGEPDRVILQRYRGGVDPESFDGSMGELEPNAPGALVRWYDSLDLMADDGRFFDESRDDQLKQIGDFFTLAFAYAEGLEPQPHATTQGPNEGSPEEFDPTPPEAFHDSPS